MEMHSIDSLRETHGIDVHHRRYRRREPGFFKRVIRSLRKRSDPLPAVERKYRQDGEMA